MEKAFEALKSYINRKQKEIFQAAKFMKIPNVNDRMAQVLKIIKDDSDRIFNSKEIEARFNISNFTARADLKLLVNLGFLEVIQVNKKKQNFIRSKHFEQILSNYNLS
jgi:Fic family protein